MDLLTDVAIRVFFYGMLFVLIVVRGAIPNPIYAALIRGSWFDRMVTRARLAIPWRLFCGMGPYTHDIAVHAFLASGEVKRWSLLNDKEVGGVPLRSDLTRLTLTFYFRDRPALWESFARAIDQHFQEAGTRLVQVEFRFLLFHSLTSPDERKPVREERVYLWSAEERSA